MNVKCFLVGSEHKSSMIPFVFQTKKIQKVARVYIAYATVLLAVVNIVLRIPFLAILHVVRTVLQVVTRINFTSAVTVFHFEKRNQNEFSQSFR